MVHGPPLRINQASRHARSQTHATFLYRASGGGINQAVQAIEKTAPFKIFQHQQGFRIIIPMDVVSYSPA
jgi:hypothetical protein